MGIHVLILRVPLCRHFEFSFCLVKLIRYPPWRHQCVFLTRSRVEQAVCAAAEVAVTFGAASATSGSAAG